ncbi:hypothetical protein LXL04_015195 [Taraxacum kok-saghyz]
MSEEKTIIKIKEEVFMWVQSRARRGVTEIPPRLRHTTTSRQPDKLACFTLDKIISLKRFPDLEVSDLNHRVLYCEIDTSPKFFFFFTKKPKILDKIFKLVLFTCYKSPGACSMSSLDLDLMNVPPDLTNSGRKMQFSNFSVTSGKTGQRGSVPASSATFSLPSHSPGIGVHSVETYDPNLKISQSDLADSDSLAIKLIPDSNGNPFPKVELIDNSQFESSVYTDNINRVAKLTRKPVISDSLEPLSDRSQHFGHFFNKVLSFFFFTKKPKILGKIFKLVMFTSCSRVIVFPIFGSLQSSPVHFTSSPIVRYSKRNPNSKRRNPALQSPAVEIGARQAAVESDRCLAVEGQAWFLADDRGWGWFLWLLWLLRFWAVRTGYCWLNCMPLKLLEGQHRFFNAEKINCRGQFGNIKMWQSPFCFGFWQQQEFKHKWLHRGG